MPPYAKSNSLPHYFTHQELTSFFKACNELQANIAFARELRHQYAIENINSWTNEEYNTYNKLVALKNNMGHTKLSRTLYYYYSMAPAYGKLIEERCDESFSELIPKFDAYEEYVRLSNLRVFLRFMSKKNVRYASIYLASKDVDLLKTEKVQIKSLTKDAIKALLSIPDIKTFTGMRDVVLMSLMYTTGCRINYELECTRK